MPTNPKPKIEDLDLVTSVEITHVGSPAKECYHFLYATHLYGTLFGMYGKFTTAPYGAGSNKLEVKDVTMRILNYQGVLNIGFASRDPEYDANQHWLDFWVQGASGKDEKRFQFKPAELIVDKGKRFLLNFNRLTVPLAGFKTAEEETQQLGAPNQVEPLFDTEFHYRNGIDHFFQVRHEGRKDTPGAQPLAGQRCLTSAVNLLYF